MKMKMKMKTISLSPTPSPQQISNFRQRYSKMARSVWCSRFSIGISCLLTPTTMILPKPDVAYCRSGDMRKALDKVRFESLTDKSNLDGQPELFIHFIPDKNNNTLTIIDSGIRMTKAAYRDQDQKFLDPHHTTTSGPEDP